MNAKHVTSFVSSLFMAWATCVEVHAEEKPANPNVAPQATVTANSENVVKRKYFAQCVVDGKIPVENQAFADDGLKQTVWAVDGPKDGRESGWLKFTRETPVEVRHVIFFAKTAWTLDECWKD